MALGVPVPSSFPTTPIGTITSLHIGEYWDITRHELVAGAADQFLTSHAREMVRVTLEPLGLIGLADVAGWADTVKDRGPRPDDDQETGAFLNDPRNLQNASWHYANLPAGADGYDRERYPTFTRDDDVVQIIREIIRVLVGDSSRFSVTNALRLVAHLVGDVHQPLHVGCAYLLKEDGDTARFSVDPNVVLHQGWQNDQCGNCLMLPISGGVRLHEYWDGALWRRKYHDDAVPEGDVAVATRSDGTAQAARARFIQKLLMIDHCSSQVGSDDANASTIPLERLAEEWATESLIAAREAYRSLGIGSQHGPHGYNVTWEGPATYDARCQPIVERRLAEASQNLAGLINAVWPES